MKLENQNNNDIKTQQHNSNADNQSQNNNRDNDEQKRKQNISSEMQKQLQLKGQQRIKQQEKTQRIVPANAKKNQIMFNAEKSEEILSNQPNHKQIQNTTVENVSHYSNIRTKQVSEKTNRSIYPLAQQKNDSGDLHYNINQYVERDYDKRMASNRKKKALPVKIILAISSCCIVIALICSVVAFLHVNDVNSDESSDNTQQIQKQLPDSSEEYMINAIEQNNSTGIIAQYGDVLIHSPVRQQDLTGLLFHQASYEYGLVMNTLLPEANEEAYLNALRSPITSTDTTDGGWMSAEALHLWRVQDNTAMDTSIDVGGASGTEIVSPVTGTVVLVKDYLLYDYVPDIQIHIQPEGHPELDLVLLHTENPLVKPGDVVIAGQTPVSHIRNLDDSLDGIQLADYSVNGSGNHTHVQLNDANYPGYREDNLQGAIADRYR